MANQEKYNLVFKGELVKGAELASTKLNIGKLFKIPAEKVENLFSGKPVTLKKGLDLDAANRYRVAIKKAGARVDMVLLDVPADKPASAPATFAPQPSSSDFSSSPSNNTDADSLSKGNTRSDPTPMPVEDSAFSLAPTGADLLNENEKHPFEEAHVDISGLSIREQSGNLLDENEYIGAEPVDVEIPNIGIAEVGADLLRPEERKLIPDVELDLAEYSLAEPGAKLGPDTPPPPPAPDVSQIKLADEK